MAVEYSTAVTLPGIQNHRYLDSQGDAAQLYETVDLLKSQPIPQP